MVSLFQMKQLFIGAAGAGLPPTKVLDHGLYIRGRAGDERLERWNDGGQPAHPICPDSVGFWILDSGSPFFHIIGDVDARRASRHSVADDQPAVVLILNQELRVVRLIIVEIRPH